MRNGNHFERDKNRVLRETGIHAGGCSAGNIGVGEHSVASKRSDSPTGACHKGGGQCTDNAAVRRNAGLRLDGGERVLAGDYGVAPGTIAEEEVQELCGRSGAFVSEPFDIKTCEQTERISMARVSSGNSEVDALQMESQLRKEPELAALAESEQRNKLQVQEGGLRHAETSTTNRSANDSRGGQLRGDSGDATRVLDQGASVPGIPADVRGDCSPISEEVGMELAESAQETSPRCESACWVALRIRSDDSPQRRRGALADRETAFVLYPHGFYTWAQRGKDAVQIHVEGNEKQSYTVMVAVTMDCRKLPLFTIVQGKTASSEWGLKLDSEGPHVSTHSPSGWMTAEAMMEWLRFLRGLPMYIGTPVIHVVMYGYATHLCNDVTALADVRDPATYHPARSHGSAPAVGPQRLWRSQGGIPSHLSLGNVPEGGQAHDEGRFRSLLDPCVGAGIGEGHPARMGVL